MDTLLVLAVLPGAVLLYYVYKMDPEEKEPTRLLAGLLFFGAVSTIPAIILEQVGTFAFLDEWEGGYYALLAFENFIVVALVEEACKFFFLRWRTWRHPAFDYIFDGVVYAVFVSLGFAIAENIGYVFEYGFGTGVLRAFTAVPGHAVFAVFMGYFYGQAKFAQVHGDGGLCATNLVLALAVPMLCHGFYDFLASAEDDIFLLVFFAFLLTMTYVAYRLVKKMAAEARRIW